MSSLYIALTLVRGPGRLSALAPLLLFFQPVTNRDRPAASRDRPATNRDIVSELENKYQPNEGLNFEQ